MLQPFRCPLRVSTVRSLHPGVAPAAVLIYVLLVFAVMGTLLSLMLSTFSANNRFAERAITDTRLRMENQSAIGKVLGLYQSDPRHPQLGPLNTARRAVSYLPYVAKREGYLAMNKAVVISIDGRDYPDRNLIPTSITVRNMPDSQGALSVIGRTIRTDTNFIESASTVQIAKPATTVSPPNETVLSLPADLTNGEQRFVRRYEIVLFSSTDVLYEAVPNGSTQFVGDRINIAVTSRNASILGANQIASSNSASYAIRPPSVILASPDSLRNGSSGTAVLSSWNYPGVSTAFIDTFDAASANDWTASGTVTYAGGTATLASGASLTYANATTAGDFDIRATFTGVATPGGVLQTTIGGTTYKIAIANVTSYQGTSTTCSTSTGAGLSYVAYSGASAPTDAGDGSSACISSHPNQYLPFAASTSATAYTLRLERRGSFLNTFFCEATATKDCERADQFTVINATPFCTNGGVSPNCNPGSTPATLAITASSSTALQYARVSQIGATAKTYTNTITLEKAVKIKQLELLGYIPPNAGLVVTTTPNLCATASNPSATCGNQTRIIPTSPTSTSTLGITLSFASASGDLSEIPFIYGIRVSYE